MERNEQTHLVFITGPANPTGANAAMLLLEAEEAISALFPRNKMEGVAIKALSSNDRKEFGTQMPLSHSDFNAPCYKEDGESICRLPREDEELLVFNFICNNDLGPTRMGMGWWLATIVQR